MEDLAQRLRNLRDQTNLTLADMSERTGIPKRSLEKYMLRANASAPGLDALCALSRGLGVSLDWLVFGHEAAGESVELFAEKAAYDVVALLIETLIKYHLEGKTALVDSNGVLGLAPEEWAADLGLRAGEKARELAASGMTKEALLLWRAASKDRLLELLKERVSGLSKATIGN